MSGARPVLVLRPEPGNAATCARVREMGRDVVSIPLFVVEPMAWDAPDAANHDALLLTSANAVRHAGDGLTNLSMLPIYAVGAATAKAARAAGLIVKAVGDGGVSEMADMLTADGRSHVLHLTGHEFTALPDGFAPTVRIVYAARERAEAEVLPALSAAPRPAHVLLHSARAARRFATLIEAAGIAPETLTLHAMSAAIAEAAGGDWGSIAIPDSPNEAAMLSALQK